MDTAAVTREVYGVAQTFAIATRAGMREFAVRDPDGHVLIFAHDISAKGGAS